MIRLDPPGTSQSDAARAPATMDSPLPEIRQLRCLIILTLRAHAKDASSGLLCCRCCGEPWPCTEVCRACDLLEVI